MVKCRPLDAPSLDPKCFLSVQCGRYRFKGSINPFGFQSPPKLYDQYLPEVEEAVAVAVEVEVVEEVAKKSIKSNTTILKSQLIHELTGGGGGEGPPYPCRFCRSTGPAKMAGNKRTKNTSAFISSTLHFGYHALSTNSVRSPFIPGRRFARNILSVSVSRRARGIFISHSLTF